MSEYANKARQPIDVEEFERRLTPPERAPHDDDPLAELERLVSGGPAEPAPRPAPAVAPPRPVVVPPAPPPLEAPAPAASWDDNLQSWEDELRGLAAGYNRPGPQASAKAEPPRIEPSAVAGPASPDALQEPVIDADEPWNEGASAYAAEEQEDYDPPPAPRRKPILWAAGASVAIAALIAGGLAFRGRAVTPHEAATILAPSGPNKVQPETQASDNASPAGAFNRTAGAVGASHVVNNEEQPVDLSAQSRARAASAGGASAAPSAGPAGGGMNSFFPEPKRVKTISVRPDGSIIASGQNAPTAPASSPPAPTPRPPVAQTPATSPATAPRPAVPKTTARIVAPTKPEANDQADASATPAPRAPAAPKPASKLASNTLSSAGATTGGGFAVQFAAAGSEAEARERLAKAQTQFASQLGGHRLGVFKAEANGKTIYRIRAGGLSKEAATALCGKVKAGGGACFVSGA